jgi:type II secretory pathway component PulJ
MNRSKGFSLVEILVGLAVGWLVLAAAGRFACSVVRYAIAEERRCGAQQGVRAALEYITREIRMAGVGTSSDERIVAARPERIIVRGEVDATASVNTVAYYLDGAVLRRKLDNAPAQPLVDGVDDLALSYLVEGSGWQPAPSQDSYSLISAVRVSIRMAGDTPLVAATAVALRPH